ncbi:MAG: MGMT family protein, partial [Oscillospiraceae bacterium]|nr:MGMT family protein [Oscillospiraceae bacterium]
ILSLVEEIPAGKVASYGQLAALAGMEKRARWVGWVLHHAEQYGSFPCHRVVSASGRTVPGWPEQRYLLEGEGVGFLPSGRVDMARYAWDCRV